MATISEEERKRLLDELREMEKNVRPGPVRKISNPKFTMPVTPPLTPGGYDVDSAGNKENARDKPDK